MSRTLDEKTWEGILSNTEEYIREARGRYDFTPSKLFRMVLLNNGLCWKCVEKALLYMHYYGNVRRFTPVGECFGPYGELVEL